MPVSRRRRAAAAAALRRPHGIQEVRFTLDTQPRRFLVRPPPTGAPKLIRMGYHGGNAGAQGAENFLNEKLTPAVSCVDYAAQAMVYNDGLGEGTTSHWQYPESLTIPPSGCDTSTDFEYQSLLIADALQRYPGVPITLVGYSSGSKLTMSWLHNAGIHPSVSAVALVKYTPLEEWLTGTPERFDYFAPPPPIFLWLSSGDVVAPQTAPNITFARTIDVWEETNASGVVPTTVSEGPGGATYDVSYYAGHNLRVVWESGTHAWNANDRTDEEFNEFVEDLLGISL